MNITILANGLFPKSATVLRFLDQADSVVCCDGALRKYLDWYLCQNSRPTHTLSIVGDGDSLSDNWLLDAEHAGIDFHHQIVSEQETNDLSKAVRHAIGDTRQKGVNDNDIDITILGATGLREDHTLGNISLLAYYITQYPDISFRMVSDFGTFSPVADRGCFASHKGEQVSLFSLTPDVPVTVSGLRYPISNRCLKWLWEATLNESLGDSFEVVGGLLIVYQRHLFTAFQS